jgi:nonribosomal peptide synthetase MxcG
VELALTAAQRSVWIGQRLRPSSPCYNAAEYLRIDGTLDTGAFGQALHQAVAETDVLHVTFKNRPTGVTQLLHEPGEWELPVIDVSSEADPGRAALAWMHTDLETVTDLETGPLFAHALFRLGPGRFWWYHRAHHIALDGYSFSLIASRTAQLYTALVTGRPCPASRFGSLRAAVDDDGTFQNSPQLETDRDFWLARFKDRPHPVSLSRHVSVPSGRFLRRSGRLPEAVMDQWRTVADQNGTTWAEVVLALVALHLHQHTGADEVVLGLPVMGRLGSAMARTPVMLMNVVPLRIALSEGTALPHLVRTVAAEMRAIRPHQRYRGEQIRRDLQLVGGRLRLYGPMVNVMPFDYGLHFAGSPAVATNLSAGAAFVEDIALLLHARSDGRPPVLDIDANPACYTDTGLTEHLDQLMRLLGETPPHAHAGQPKPTREGQP